MLWTGMTGCVMCSESLMVYMMKSLFCGDMYKLCMFLL